MKKRNEVLSGFAVLLITILLVLSNCASYGFFYKQDGLVPLGYFQAIKKQDERLVFISTRLIPNHRQSGLYIITNPENTQDALGVLRDPSVIAPNEVVRILKPYSPVLIMSNNFGNGSEDGIAAFSLPASVDQFFYAYVRINQNYRWNSNDPVEVRSGIIPLPSGSDDICITFSEKNGDIEIIANSNPDFIQLIYDTSTGFYGRYIGKGEQAGFIPIRFKERFEIAKITPPPQNIELPQQVEQYNIPVMTTLIGEYSGYAPTIHDIVAPTNRYQLSKLQILDWISLNEGNENFHNAMAICMIIADGFEYEIGEFVCVDYCAIFVGIDDEYNYGRLSNKIVPVADDDHIWLRVNIPNRYRDANGIIRMAEYLWVDPTWFDNGGAYNFNFFTWGGSNVSQFMEGQNSDQHYCHKYGQALSANGGPQIAGFTYSLVNYAGRYSCIADDLGRRNW